MLGLGTDIIEISRIRNSIKRYDKHFLDKVFTSREQIYCARHQDPVPHYAGRFAAKEAAIKALGIGFKAGYSWTDIEILNDRNGKPEIIVSSTIEKLFSKEGNPLRFLLSMSHCREHATATVIRTS